MSDLISRSALLDMSYSIRKSTWDNPYGGRSVVDVDDIENAPTIEARPVVHARWIMGFDIADYEYGVCSACGYDERHAFPCNYTPKFCPECGATMDGKEYEEE